MKFFNNIIKFEPRIGFLPLQNRRDIENELIFQLKSISKADCDIFEIIEKDNIETKIIVYGDYGEDVLLEDATDIVLKTRIIKKKGILVPEPWLHASFTEGFKKIKISDLNLNKAFVNEGYGSLLLSNLIRLAKEYHAEEISGWISGVDYNHIDRLVHFYEKHNFKVTLDENTSSMKIGELLWLNE